MKVLSTIIISVTLFVFYNLAIYQQGLWEQKSEGKLISPVNTEEIITEALTDHKSYCMQTEVLNHRFEIVDEHHGSEDEFAMQVSGKDHRYLNTGISFIEPVNKSHANLEIADTSNDPDSQKIKL